MVIDYFFAYSMIIVAVIILLLIITIYKLLRSLYNSFHIELEIVRKEIEKNNERVVDIMRHLHAMSGIDILRTNKKIQKILDILNSEEGDKMNFKPLGKRVFIKLEKPDEEIKKGVVIPDVAKNNVAYKRGKVIAIGEEVPNTIKVGDTIISTQFSGNWVNESEDLLSVSYSDALCVVELNKED